MWNSDNFKILAICYIAAFVLVNLGWGYWVYRLTIQGGRGGQPSNVAIYTLPILVALLMSLPLVFGFILFSGTHR